jgi:hypothetical protein
MNENHIMYIFVNTVILVLGIYHKEIMCVFTKISIPRIFSTAWLILSKKWSHIKCSTRETLLAAIKYDVMDSPFKDQHITKGISNSLILFCSKQNVCYKTIFQIQKNDLFIYSKNFVKLCISFQLWLCLHSRIKVDFFLLLNLIFYFFCMNYLCNDLP